MDPTDERSGAETPGRETPAAGGAGTGARRPYHAPALRVYGAAADLTAAMTMSGNLDGAMVGYVNLVTN